MTRWRKPKTLRPWHQVRYKWSWKYDSMEGNALARHIESDDNHGMLLAISEINVWPLAAWLDKYAALQSPMRWNLLGLEVEWDGYNGPVKAWWRVENTLFDTELNTIRFLRSWILAFSGVLEVGIPRES